jgi:hypothetical protein
LRLETAMIEIEHPRGSDRHRPAAPPSVPDLFAWSGGGIVLLGERTADRWVVARGWCQGDRLTDVRRWFFADPRAFAGQIRRLAHDATGDHGAARAAAADALAWTSLSA